MPKVERVATSHQTVKNLRLAEGGNIEKPAGLTETESPAQLTATADGLTTGLLTANVRYAEVAAFTTDANDIVTLPAALKGMSVKLIATVGCEVRTPAASNETINAVDSDGTNELALVAGNLYFFECVADGGWIARGWSAAGAALATLTPDLA